MISALLLAASLAAPAQALSPARRAEIAAAAANWPTWRERAYTMMARYPSAVARDYGARAELDAHLREVKSLLESTVSVQATTADIVLEHLRSTVAPGPERKARERAVEDLRDARYLALYGNMIPRILDETVKDGSGASIGRRYAGPEWAVVADFEGELRPYGREVRAATGYSADEYDAFEAKARAFLGLPPPQR